MHQRGQCGAGAGMHGEVRQLRGATDGASHQQLVPPAAAGRAGLARPGHLGQCPVVVPLTLRALPARAALEDQRELGNQQVNPYRANRPGHHGLIARDRRHIALATAFECRAQLAVLPVDGIGGHPGERNPGGTGPLHQVSAQTRLGDHGPAAVGGYPGIPAARQAPGPGLPEVQGKVNARPYQVAYDRNTATW